MWWTLGLGVSKQFIYTFYQSCWWVLPQCDRACISARATCLMPATGTSGKARSSPDHWPDFVDLWPHWEARKTDSRKLCWTKVREKCSWSLWMRDVSVWQYLQQLDLCVKFITKLQGSTVHLWLLYLLARSPFIKRITFGQKR